MVTRLMTDTICPAQRANLKIAAADLTRDGLPDLSDGRRPRHCGLCPIDRQTYGIVEVHRSAELNDYPADG
jgi:hypothetical protein